MSLARNRQIPNCVILVILFLMGVGGFTNQRAGAQESPSLPTNPLVQILQQKGLLTTEEAQQIESAASPRQADERIARILLTKGAISASDYRQITGNAPEGSPAQALQAAVALVRGPATSAMTPQSSAPVPQTTLHSSTIIAAVAPLRALPVGAIKHDARAPAFKAEGVGFAPYGFIKITGIEDSSSPSGDDFPLPGFLCDTGPDGAPEFHVKARATRFGSNFAWFGPSDRWNITGKIEIDFEGNFNRSDNRNLSSVRSNNPSLRLAWGRLDYSADKNNSFSALFGQDWTPFGSSTLPNILETTGIGIGFGTLYERNPQMRFGYTRQAGAVRIEPEFAITMPVEGLTPGAAFLSQQLGYGERQGPDSNRPGEEARVAVEWPLDRAAGVAPAQFVVSAEHGERTAVVLASAVPAEYQKTFPTGARGTSHSDGWDVEAQLPTRYATLIGKFYSGADLRFFFAGQLYSFFNDEAGLRQIASAASVDGASTVVFGTDAQGRQVIAPERPVRADGGFAQLSLPLSRILRASADGRNAGWTFSALYGVDQAKTRDLNRMGGSRRYSTMAIGTLSYSLNRWVSFSAEQSLYTTHANPEQKLPLFKGVPSREWNDIRSEFGPTFVF